MYHRDDIPPEGWHLISSITLYHGSEREMSRPSLSLGRPNGDFGRIFSKVPFSGIVRMYHPYHEMDVTAFVSEMERRIGERPSQPRLKILRENRGWSQSQLAEASGINIRSIQLYEQRVNDIDRAQARTVYRLASALTCSVEEPPIDRC